MILSDYPIKLGFIPDNNKLEKKISKSNPIVVHFTGLHMSKVVYRRRDGWLTDATNVGKSLIVSIKI